MGVLRRALSILLRAAVLQSCGGGRAAVPSAPQPAGDSLRARAVAAQAVAPDQAARQLMDFGEAQFPQCFPSRQPTQSLPPFAYRHNPRTGVYLGVGSGCRLDEGSSPDRQAPVNFDYFAP